MKQVQQIKNYCYPIDYCIDYNKLYNSISELLSKLGLTFEYINKVCNTQFGYTINLTHLPDLAGPDRWRKYSGNHPSVVRQRVREVDFVEMLNEIKGTYLGKVIDDVYQQHPGSFQGRAQLIWVGPKQRYPVHRDLHTPNRYHIPIITNQLCYWILAEKNHDPVKLVMPADGRVWYLNPVELEHTFVNDSNVPRLHLLLTSGL